MRRERWQDLRRGAVLVDVAGDPEAGQVADLGGAADGAAEDQDRQPPAVELADGTHQFDTAGVGEPEIDHHQIDVRQIRADPGQQFGRTPDGEGPVAGVLDRGLEPVPNERGIIGNHDGFVHGASHCHSVQVYRIGPGGTLGGVVTSLQAGMACRYNPGSRRDNRRRVSSYVDAAGTAQALNPAAGARAAR